MTPLRCSVFLLSATLAGCGPNDPITRVRRDVEDFFDALARTLLFAGVTLYTVLILGALNTIRRNLGPKKDSSGLGFALSTPHIIFGGLGTVGFLLAGAPQPSQPDYQLLLAVNGMAAGALVVGLVCFVAAWCARS